MDWEGLNKINIIIGLINGVWGIGNIGIASWNFLSIKNKKKFLEELDIERKVAQKENERACRNCKNSFKQQIKVLERTNEKLLDKVPG